MRTSSALVLPLNIDCPRGEFLAPFFLYGLAKVSIFKPPIIEDHSPTNDHQPIEVSVNKEDAVDRKEDEANEADGP
jgi:hypothetical protein